MRQFSHRIFVFPYFFNLNPIVFSYLTLTVHFAVFPLEVFAVIIAVPFSF